MLGMPVPSSRTSMRSQRGSTRASAKRRRRPHTLISSGRSSTGRVALWITGGERYGPPPVEGPAVPPAVPPAVSGARGASSSTWPRQGMVTPQGSSTSTGALPGVSWKRRLRGPVRSLWRARCASIAYTASTVSSTLRLGSVIAAWSWANPRSQEGGRSIFSSR